MCRPGRLHPPGRAGFVVSTDAMIGFSIADIGGSVALAAEVEISVRDGKISGPFFIRT
jgi:hypothetical protein